LVTLFAIPSRKLLNNIWLWTWHWSTFVLQMNWKRFKGKTAKDTAANQRSGISSPRIVPSRPFEPSTYNRSNAPECPSHPHRPSSNPSHPHPLVQTLATWYVSNVSIIFDAPCLFLHHLPCVSLHFVAFLCDFRN
jgi:hypothetical protein